LLLQKQLEIHHEDLVDFFCFLGLGWGFSSSTAKPRINSFWENKISQSSAWNMGVGAQSKVSV
jgi:hypothetical protein